MTGTEGTAGAAETIADHVGAMSASSKPDWVRIVQQVLDFVPGNHALLLPIRDATGELRDFRVIAAAPGTVDAYGRTGDELIGSRLRATYQVATNSPVWEAIRDAYLEGGPRTAGPFPYPRTTGGPPMWFTLTLRRIGPGLLDSWSRADDVGQPEERVRRMERLANLGWSVHDWVTGTTTWSDQLYRIFARDPAEGPMSDEQWRAVIVPADREVRRRFQEALSSGRPADVTYRIHVGGVEKHIRAVAEPVSDAHGRRLKTVGIVQDVTDRVNSGRRLVRAEQQVSEQRETLAAESRLATALQQIILPIPGAPIDLPGLRVGVQYLPAEQANRIGGDWYYAGTAFDGSVVIAVGDVAGHGIRAAAAMAQQRHALATLTGAATSEPAELLRYLSRLIYTEDEPTGIASAVVARYHPDSGTLEWAQAGHPPPLRSRAGSTVALDRPAGIMLGVVPEPRYETARTAIEAGDLLLLYTDGLVERRGQPPDDGMRQVAATLDRVTRQYGPHPLADLLGRLDRANPADDTCVLAVRLRTAQEAAARPVGTGYRSRPAAGGA